MCFLVPLTQKRHGRSTATADSKASISTEAAAEAELAASVSINKNVRGQEPTELAVWERAWQRLQQTHDEARPVEAEWIAMDKRTAAGANSYAFYDPAVMPLEDEPIVVLEQELPIVPTEEEELEQQVWTFGSSLPLSRSVALATTTVENDQSALDRAVAAAKAAEEIAAEERLIDSFTPTLTDIAPPPLASSSPGAHQAKRKKSAQSPPDAAAEDRKPRRITQPVRPAITISDFCIEPPVTSAFSVDDVFGAASSFLVHARRIEGIREVEDVKRYVQQPAFLHDTRVMLSHLIHGQMHTNFVSQEELLLFVLSFVVRASAGRTLKNLNVYSVRNLRAISGAMLKLVTDEVIPRLFVAMPPASILIKEFCTSCATFRMRFKAFLFAIKNWYEPEVRDMQVSCMQRMIADVGWLVALYDHLENPMGNIITIRSIEMSIAEHYDRMTIWGCIGKFEALYPEVVTAARSLGHYPTR